jgi:import receptor subunit TOM70
MERFQNASAGESVERVLKKISTKKAEEIMKAREPKLPSTTFVSSYLGAFRPRESGANVKDQQGTCD